MPEAAYLDLPPDVLRVHALLRARTEAVKCLVAERLQQLAAATRRLEHAIRAARRAALRLLNQTGRDVPVTDAQPAPASRFIHTMPADPADPRPRLLLADVDGTLVTKEKRLTDRAVAAVQKLRARGIEFAVTSGRPPRGMQMLIAPLGITTPIAAFNGGLFVKPDLSTISEHVLDRDVVAPIIKLMEEHRLDVWIYSGQDWFVHERHGTHVDREEWTVKFAPTVVASYGDRMDRVAKVVGVSDDLEAVARCEKAVREAYGPHVGTAQSTPHRDGGEPPAVTAARSQPYYLDVTHPEANKGGVVRYLARQFNLRPEEIATIGDMPNDVSMFERGGLSISMGQSSDEVKSAAKEVTTSSEDEGFANAVEKFVLGEG